jgi:trans-aconitate 2-methyltransferase
VRWDPAQYGQFPAERNRPFFDLTARIEATSPRHVVDIGCGQGHLTAALAKRWPDAVVEGLDSSPEMIAAAADISGVRFSVADASDWRPSGDVDVIVSNAALQWVPRHHQLMAEWASALPRDGWLAVQVPGNFDSPSHVLMRQLADHERWAADSRNVLRHTDAVGSPESYAGVLLDAGLDADVWETTYLHVLHGDDSVLEWLRGTGLRPILAALSPSDSDEFASQLSAELRKAYPPGPRGTLFPFRRVFAVGHKP